MSADQAVVEAPESAAKSGGLSTKAKVLIGLGVYLGIAILLVLIFGSDGKNEAFKPQNEFKLEPWVGDPPRRRRPQHQQGGPLPGAGQRPDDRHDDSGSRARMQQKPNRVQTAIEVAYDMTKNTIAGGSLDTEMAARWFPFLAALFFWIWFSNMIGFIPLPTNTEHTINVFGAEIPSFAIYAATANLSIPLVLTLVVWVSYHVEGIRAKGLVQVPGQLAAARASRT